MKLAERGTLSAVFQMVSHDLKNLENRLIPRVCLSHAVSCRTLQSHLDLMVGMLGKRGWRRVAMPKKTKEIAAAQLPRLPVGLHAAGGYCAARTYLEDAAAAYEEALRDGCPEIWA